MSAWTTYRDAGMPGLYSLWKAAYIAALREASEEVELRGDWSRHGNADPVWNAEAEASCWLEDRANNEATRQPSS